MTLFRCGLLVLALAGAARSNQATANELLSIRGIGLAENGYISGFHVDTWGVRVLAVCHLPPGWTITAGNSADPSGVLEGTASLGVTFLNRHDVSQLDNLFLIDVVNYRPQEARLPNQPGLIHPASFRGKASIGVYGPDDTIHDVQLTPANLVREPASQCPPQ